MKDVANTFLSFWNDSEGPAQIIGCHWACLMMGALKTPWFFLPARLRAKKTWVQFLTLPLTSCVISGRDSMSLNLSFLTCEVGTMTGSYRAVGLGIKCTAQCPEHDTLTCLLQSRSKSICHLFPLNASLPLGVPILVSGSICSATQ